MWPFVLVSLLLLYFYFKLNKIYGYWKEKRIPFVKPVYLLGNFTRNIFQLQSLHDTFDDIYNSQPGARYIGFYALLEPNLMIRDIELIKQLTIKDFDAFSDHSMEVSPSVDVLWSKNLFSLTRERGWSEVRAVLSPTFSRCKLQKMFALMQECSQQFISHLKAQGGPITMEVKETFSRFGADVIGSTTFGITCDSLKEKNNPFYVMGKELTDFSGFKSLRGLTFLLSSTLTKLLQIRMVSKEVAAFFTNIIEGNLKTRRDNQIVRSDMLHLLLESQNDDTDNQNLKSPETNEPFVPVDEHNHNTRRKPKVNLTDEDITALAIGFFFAGFDTTSTLLSYLTYELAANPDIQKKLHLEIKAIRGNRIESITYEELLGMRYLDNILSECLRLHSPVVFLDRKCLKPYTIPAEIAGENALPLEKGQKIWIPIRQIHRDPKFYPNPLKFDPERYNDDNKQNILPSSYIPFGSGPRKCIGSRFALLECKIAIVDLIREFELVCVNKMEIPLKLDPAKGGPLPKNGIWLRLIPRSS